MNLYKIPPWDQDDCKKLQFSFPARAVVLLRGRENYSTVGNFFIAKTARDFEIWVRVKKGFGLGFRVKVRVSAKLNTLVARKALQPPQQQKAFPLSSVPWSSFFLQTSWVSVQDLPTTPSRIMRCAQPKLHSCSLILVQVQGGPTDCVSSLTWSPRGAAKSLLVCLMKEIKCLFTLHVYRLFLSLCDELHAFTFCNVALLRFFLHFLCTVHLLVWPASLLKWRRVGKGGRGVRTPLE